MVISVLTCAVEYPNGGKDSLLAAVGAQGREVPVLGTRHDPIAVGGVGEAGNIRDAVRSPIREPVLVGKVQPCFGVEPQYLAGAGEHRGGLLAGDRLVRSKFGIGDTVNDAQRVGIAYIGAGCMLRPWS